MTISGVSCLLFFNFSFEIDKRTEIERKRDGLNSNYKSAQALAQSLSFVVHCRQRQDGPSVVGLNPIFDNFLDWPFSASFLYFCLLYLNVQWWMKVADVIV